MACVNFFRFKVQNLKADGKTFHGRLFAVLFAVKVTINFSILEQLPFSHVMILWQAVNCHSTSLNYSISVLTILSRALFTDVCL